MSIFTYNLFLIWTGPGFGVRLALTRGDANSLNNMKYIRQHIVLSNLYIF